MIIESAVFLTAAWLIGQHQLRKWEAVKSEGDALLAGARADEMAKRSREARTAYRNDVMEHGRQCLCAMNISRVAEGKPEAHNLADVIAAISDYNPDIVAQIRDDRLDPRERAMLEFAASGGKGQRNSPGSNP